MKSSNNENIPDLQSSLRTGVQSSHDVDVSSNILVQVAKSKSSDANMLRKGRSKLSKLPKSKEVESSNIVKRGKTKVKKDDQESTTKVKKSSKKIQAVAKTKLKPSIEVKSVGKSKVKLKGSYVRRVRCGSCVGCQSANCGSCRFCLDMTCFGGNNKLRQACVDRVCVKKLAMMKKAENGKTSSSKKQPK